MVHRSLEPTKPAPLYPSLLSLTLWHLCKDLVPAQHILTQLLLGPLSPIIPTIFLFSSLSIFGTCFALGTGPNTSRRDEFRVFKDGGSTE